MSENTSHFKKLYATLREDFDLTARAAHGTDGISRYPDPVLLAAHERRALVRSAFALMEAVIYRLKQSAVDSNASVELSDAERALAQEHQYELTDNGEPHTRNARLRFASNLRFAFALFAKVSESSYKLDAAGKGWQSLKTAVGIRDRLMHPKLPADLEVTDDEIRDVLAASTWFDVSLVLLLKDSVESLRASNDARQKQLGHT